jgi:hypothetical protein
MSNASISMKTQQAAALYKLNNIDLSQEVPVNTGKPVKQQWRAVYQSVCITTKYS